MPLFADSVPVTDIVCPTYQTIDGVVSAADCSDVDGIEYTITCTDPSGDGITLVDSTEGPTLNVSSGCMIVARAVNGNTPGEASAGVFYGVSVLGPVSFDVDVPDFSDYTDSCNGGSLGLVCTFMSIP